jgi:diguanylate cyclase (GGDEF)-like protein/PAS domain S-box-containing protein
MQDGKKTKEQLLDELLEMRRCICDLETLEADHGVVQEKLKQQLDFVQMLLDAIPSPVFFKNREGEYIGCNRAFMEFIGRSEEDIIGKTVYDMGPKEIADKYFEKDSELFENPGKQHYEWKVKRKDGEIRDVIFNKATFTDQEGKVGGLIGVISDITERKKAEKTLRESESKYNYLFNHLSDAAFILDLDGRFLDVNDVAMRRFGYSRDEFMQMTPREINAPEYTATVKERIKQVQQVGHISFETVHLTKAGRKIPTEISSRLIQIEGKSAIIALARDISERKQTENGLKSSEERYRSLVESSDDSIYVVDKDYKYLFINRKHLARVGVPKERMVGRSYGEIHSSEETKVFISKVNEVFKEGISVKHEHKSERDNRYFLRTLSPIKSSDGQTVAATVISKDISDRKKLEEELRELSLTDELTGLYNRRGFFTMAEHLLKLSNRNRTGLFMLYADVDSLKGVNDAYGHKEGDRALKEIADILKENYRESDIIARIGGDELVVIPVGAVGDTEEVIRARFKRVLQAYNEKQKLDYELSVSIGMSYYDPECPSCLDDLLIQADNSMYEEKKHKRKS